MSLSPGLGLIFSQEAQCSPCSPSGSQDPGLRTWTPKVAKGGCFCPGARLSTLWCLGRGWGWGAHFTTTGRSPASRLFFPFEHLRDPDLQAASPRSAPSTSKQRTESPTILVSNFWPCRFGVPVPGPPRLRLSPATSCAETQDSGPKTGTWRTSPPRNPTT